MRNVYYKVHTLIEEEKSKGLITALVGNHAQGAAYTAKLAGMRAAVVMSTTTPLMKASRIKNYGADVVLEGDVFDEACDHAYKLTGEFGYTYVHPSGDLGVTTGQGTIAMEIIKELPTVDCILVPADRGSLCTDVSTLAKLLNPKIKVIGMEPVGANCMQASPKEGKVVGLPQASTITDGMAAKRPGKKLFPYIQEDVDGVIAIKDSELIVTSLDMVGGHRMIVESSGLLAMVTLKHLSAQRKKIVSILSGGNIDVITMSSIIRRGPTERDRVFTASVLPSDKPGELARVSTLLAKKRDNIVKLEHNQFISINRDATVELRVTMETLGTGHENQIVSALTSTGYRPKLIKFKGTYSEM